MIPNCWLYSLVNLCWSPIIPSSHAFYAVPCQCMSNFLIRKYIRWYEVRNWRETGLISYTLTQKMTKWHNRWCPGSGITGSNSKPSYLRIVSKYPPSCKTWRRKCEPVSYYTVQKASKGPRRKRRRKLYRKRTESRVLNGCRDWQAAAAAPCDFVIDFKLGIEVFLMAARFGAWPQNKTVNEASEFFIWMESA